MKNSTFFMVFCLAAFSSAIMLYVTGLELTTLTNLLFIIIPQGYLPCAKLFMLFDVSDIEFPPIVFFSLTGRSYVYFNTIGVFFQLIGKPFSSHATIAWFFFISIKDVPQKAGRLFCSGVNYTIKCNR